APPAVRLREPARLRRLGRPRQRRRQPVADDHGAGRTRHDVRGRLRRMDLDRDRIRELTERESTSLDQRTRASGSLYERAGQVLSGGVASSYQARDPWPLYLSHGAGPKVWDVDGNELYDFHNGFGSMVQGHAHPAIGHAVRERYDQGTHFAAP